MHPDAYEYVARWAASERMPYKPRILEIGSRNVNGSVRPIFTSFDSYTGIDLLPGPDVDKVADIRFFSRYFFGKAIHIYDLIICCEVLEHSDDVRQIIYSSYQLLVSAGYFLFTCAGPTRPEHSAIDAGELRKNEYYHNLNMEYLQRCIVKSGFTHWDMEYNPYDKWFPVGREKQDIYGWAQK